MLRNACRSGRPGSICNGLLIVDPITFDFSICHLGMMNACGFGKSPARFALSAQGRSGTRSFVDP
jgi:hypothetical protein